MTRRWKASRLIYRVDKLWGGYNSSRRLSERLERTATSTREGNARGRPSDIAQALGSRSVSKAMECAWRGPQVGGEGRSKPSALRRLSHLFSFFRARSGRWARSNTYGGPSAGSRLQEWLLGRRGGGDRKALGTRNGVLDVVFRKTKRARTMAERIGARASRKGRGIICRLPSRIGEN